MALIKREILTSHKVLCALSVPVLQKDAFQTTDFSRLNCQLKVARYSFAGSIPAKFEHKLRRQKQSFGKIATTVVLNKAENFF